MYLQASYNALYGLFILFSGLIHFNPPALLTILTEAGKDVFLTTRAE